MGYTLRIGELTTEIETDGNITWVNITAISESLEAAPAYGEPTDHSNSRWPSYIAWRDFARFAGLKDFFYNKEYGLIRQHPGCFPLLKYHQDVIDKAYNDYFEKYPNCKPGFSPKLSDEKMIFEDREWPIENSYAVRLVWLKFWIDWALLNCKVPVFSNY